MEKEIRFVTINLATLDECFEYAKNTANAGWTILKLSIEHNEAEHTYTVLVKGYIEQWE